MSSGRTAARGVDRPEVADAFRRFESARKPRTSRVQLSSRTNTWLRDQGLIRIGSTGTIRGPIHWPTTRRTRRLAADALETYPITPTRGKIVKAAMSGHQRRFERAPVRSAWPLISDVLLSRSRRRSGPFKRITTTSSRPRSTTLAAASLNGAMRVSRDGAPFRERRAVACPRAQGSCTRAPAQSQARRERARHWRPLDIRQSGRRAAL